MKENLEILANTSLYLWNGACSHYGGL